MDICVPVRWLHEAWCKTTSFQTKPQCVVSNGNIKVTVFRASGIGMTARTLPLDTTNDCCFEVPDAMRAYCHHLQFASDVRLKLNDGTLEIILEMPSFAIQYKIPKIQLVEDLYVAPSDTDIVVEIGTDDWLNICTTMPAKGQIEIACTDQKKMVTLKHTRRRWAAAIMARSKATASASFSCSASVAKTCFKREENLPAFSTLVFMGCGVLKWNAGYLRVHLAPNVD